MNYWLSDVAETYYVSKKAHQDSSHQIHSSSCSCLTDEINYQVFGKFDNCCDAVFKAIDVFDKVEGCWCCCCVDCNLG